MNRQIFVNLPVKDLPKAKAFYQAIGAVNNPQFTDETAACMVWSEAIYVMLLTHEKWSFFTQKPLVDAHRTSEVMLALSCESREAVNALIEAVGLAGGKVDVNPAQDHGFMVDRAFEDLDGHIWEAFWMDPAKVNP